MLKAAKMFFTSYTFLHEQEIINLTGGLGAREGGGLPRISKFPICLSVCSPHQKGVTAFFDSAVSCKPDEEDFLIFWQQTSVT